MDKLDEIEITSVSGRITETVGMIIRAVIPNVKIGEVCLVKREGIEPLMCEVVGFTSEEVILSPLGEMVGVGSSSEVIPTHRPLSVGVSPSILGRVLDALGRPLDVATKGPLEITEYVPIMRAPLIQRSGR
jgi:type III secretion protein N (ATPase)